MLRSLLILLSRLPWAQRFIMRWRFAWRVASRFIAGETRQDAIRAVQALNDAGINATVDFLGENVRTNSEADQAAREVLAMLVDIQAAGVRANVSIKLSQMGLSIDPARCYANLQRILQTAAEQGNFIRIDMEDSSATQATIELFTSLRRAGYDNVGIVIQAYLYRSEQDLRDLHELGARIRLCKGAYKEPAEIAFPKKSAVDQNYDQLTLALLHSALEHGAPQGSADGKIPPIPAIATHDVRRIEHALEQACRLGLPQGAYEFQMLYGIRRDLQRQLAGQGHPVRVYVPYGTHWYPYFMRRLAERPANVWFFLSGLVKK